MELLYWFFVILVAYVYAGYPLIVVVLRRIRPAPPVRKASMTPSVTFIIAAHNEERSIAEKLDNTLAAAYPMDKVEIVVASDGSTDDTNQIVKRYENRGVTLVAVDAHLGKSAVQNVAASCTNSDIILFTDANVSMRPNALAILMRNFADARIGCVIGYAAFINEGDTTVSDGEGFYWRYERFLRGQESLLGNFVIGSGAIMAVRRTLFRILDPDVGEDFVLPILTAIDGCRVVYEPEAIAEEILFQNDAGSMLASKVRIITKDLGGLFLHRAILHPFKHPLYAWGLISHKLLRWLVPYDLILILALNVVLLDRSMYSFLMTLQISFYGLAILGYIWQHTRRTPRLVGIPFAFCLVNMAALIGVARFVTGKRSGQWQPVR